MPSRARRRGALAFLIVVSLAAALGVVTLFATTPMQPSVERIFEFATLLAGFGVTRALTIEIETRRDTARIDPSEMLLLIGMLFLPAPCVLAAVVITTLTWRILRADSATRVLYGGSVAALWVVLTDLLARVVFRVAWPELPDWTTILAGFLVAHAVVSVLRWSNMVLVAGRRPLAAARPVLRTHLAGLFHAGAAIAVVVAVLTIDWGWLVACLFTLGTAATYRSYRVLLHHHRDTRVLTEFTGRVARLVAGDGSDHVADHGGDHGGPVPGGGAENSGHHGGGTAWSEPEWAAAMDIARKQLDARRVVLHLVSPRGERRTIVAGRPLPHRVSYDELLPLARFARLDFEPRVWRLTRRDAGPAVGAALAARGANEMLVAPLGGTQELFGVMEVHDRKHRVRRFGEPEIRLLALLANHITNRIDNRRLVAQLRQDAYQDPLTDLSNRLGFRQSAQEELAQASPGAVLVVALDPPPHELGSHWGERLVLTASARLRAVLPGWALIARLESYTFAALLTGAEAERVPEFAQAAQETLAVPYLVDDIAVECGAAAGVAPSWIDPVSDVDVLLQRANVALQAARGGEDAVRAYSPSMGQLSRRRFHLVTDFRQALDDGQVDVHFQPQLALPGRQVIGAEALVRWRHPEFGMVNPAEFVEVVEGTDMIDALTDFVLHRSLRQCRRWLESGLSLTVAVNISARNLADPEFATRVLAALRQYDIPASLLAFELTESSMISDLTNALPVLRELHRIGVRIAVDDFGTGYSSLLYLRQLPVDEVKIDRRFVRGLVHDLCDVAVVRAIVELGHSLGLTVVAEGVEDNETLDLLMDIGSDVAQGYLISSPLGTGSFDNWLRDSTVRDPGVRDEAVLTLLP